MSTKKKHTTENCTFCRGDRLVEWVTQKPLTEWMKEHEKDDISFMPPVVAVCSRCHGDTGSVRMQMTISKSLVGQYVAFHHLSHFPAVQHGVGVVSRLYSNGWLEITPLMRPEVKVAVSPMCFSRQVTVLPWQVAYCREDYKVKAKEVKPDGEGKTGGARRRLLSRKQRS